MDNSNMFLLIVAGMIATPLVSFLKGNSWPNNLKVAFSMGFCLVIALVGAFLAGTLNSVNDVVSNFAIVWASSQALYSTWFSGTATNESLSSMKVLG
jgi:hypothetical protein